MMTMTMTISEDLVHVNVADASTRCVNPADTSQSISPVARAVRQVVHLAVPVGHLAAGAVEASAVVVLPADGNIPNDNNTYTHRR